jgi:hypothetical protein
MGVVASWRALIHRLGVPQANVFVLLCGLTKSLSKRIISEIAILIGWKNSLPAIYRQNKLESLLMLIKLVAKLGDRALFRLSVPITRSAPSLGEYLSY